MNVKFSCYTPSTFLRDSILEDVPLTPSSTIIRYKSCKIVVDMEPSVLMLQTFRLLDLPEEIQENVLIRYYEDASLHVRFGQADQHGWSKPQLYGTPSLGIEMTNHDIRRIALDVRDRYMPRSLTVNYSGDRPTEFFDNLLRHHDLTWLRQHIDNVNFPSLKPGSVITSWPRLVSIWKNVRLFHFTRTIDLSRMPIVPPYLLAQPTFIRQSVVETARGQFDFMLFQLMEPLNLIGLVHALDEDGRADATIDVNCTSFEFRKGFTETKLIDRGYAYLLLKARIKVTKDGYKVKERVCELGSMTARWAVETGIVEVEDAAKNTNVELNERID
ncbi:hypothetical protein LTR64_001678 [Lithohypha guttulata]|uniref:uncharacterized protein n=1 Tax=Lithohypha guttulata TaxID=1690604 RepID=UPI002DDF61BD|nr:hypothetical protein LTR51_003872 [Lithohypha guttulata]